MTSRLIDTNAAGAILGISGRHFRRLFTETGRIPTVWFRTRSREPHRQLRVHSNDVIQLQIWFKRSKAGRPKGKSK